MKYNLLNEMYSCYYSTMFHILKEAGCKKLTNDELCNLIHEKAEQYGFHKLTAEIINGHFGTIVEYKDEDNEQEWPVFVKDKDGQFINRLPNITEFPLSTLEKMWLKSIYSDPRINLFVEKGVELPELEGILPLFDREDYVLFDQYLDGDPFRDEHYIKVFRGLLKSIDHRSRLKVVFRKKNNNVNNDYKIDQGSKDEQIVGMIIIPEYLEYSERDDRFQLIGYNSNHAMVIINVASIIECKEVKQRAWEKETANVLIKQTLKKVVVRVTNVENLLESFLMELSYYEKKKLEIDESSQSVDAEIWGDEIGNVPQMEAYIDRTEQDVKDNYMKKEKNKKRENYKAYQSDFYKEGEKYYIEIEYDETDEMDLLIKLLSFGPDIKVIGPDSFVELIRERLQQQINTQKLIGNEVFNNISSGRGR